MKKISWLAPILCLGVTSCSAIGFGITSQSQSEASVFSSSSSPVSSVSTTSSKQSQSESSSSFSSAPVSSNSVSSSPSSSEEPSSSASSESISSSQTQSSFSADFLELFAPESRVKMKLNFPEASLRAINDYQSNARGQLVDAYFPADLEVDINDVHYSFEEVGVRMKGNTSRTTILDGEGRIYRTCHFKVSLKATFDDPEYDSFSQLQPFKKTWDDQNARKTRKKRNLCGLEKFDLKYVPRNIGYGYGCTAREIYCFNRFREEGLPAAYANLVTLTLTNPTSSYESSYELIEPIDKEFLKKRFGKEEAQGDLYKCVYNGMGKADLSREGAVAKNQTDGHSSGERVAWGKIGVENNYEYYVPCYQLKTNDDLGEDSDFLKMAGFIHAMWDLNYGKGTQQLLEQTLDVDEFLRFSAMSYLLCNFDDQRYNYNNYYLYFLPSTGKAIYIPYDWDWSLGYTPSGDSDVVNSAPLDEVTLDGNRPANVYYATIFNSNSNTQYSRKQYQDDYLSYVAQYAPRTLDINAFESLISTLGCTNIEVSQVQHYFEVKAAKI